MQSLIANLMLSIVMVTFTVVVHFLGLIVLLRLISRQGSNLRGTRLHAILRQCLMLITAVLGIVVLHTIEIWSYAFMFEFLGATQGFEPSLYFSTVSFTSLGYGDMVLDPRWRVFGAIEAANGLILFGWSTAFLLTLMGKLRALEQDWLEVGHHLPPARPAGE